MLPADPQETNTLPRSTQLGMAVVLLLLAGVLLYRGYAGTSPKPLQQDHGTVAYRIDLNRATEAELQLLPGVGPTLAEKIHAHRGNHGPFQSVEELQSVPGIGSTTLNTLKPWVETAVVQPRPQLDDDVPRLERKPNEASQPALPAWSAGPVSCNPVKGSSMSTTHPNRSCCDYPESGQRWQEESLWNEEYSDSSTWRICDGCKASAGKHSRRSGH